MEPGAQTRPLRQLEWCPYGVTHICFSFMTKVYSPAASKRHGGSAHCYSLHPIDRPLVMQSIMMQGSPRCADCLIRAHMGMHARHCWLCPASRSFGASFLRLDFQGAA